MAPRAATAEKNNGNHPHGLLRIVHAMADAEDICRKQLKFLNILPAAVTEMYREEFKVRVTKINPMSMPMRGKE